MMLVEETTVPEAALPVAAFKQHLRLGTGFADDGLQDLLVEQVLRAAMATIEARTGKILIERDFSWTISVWRDGSEQALPVAPVSAITGLVVIDRQGVETLAPPDAWRLVPDQQRPRLVADSGVLPCVPKGGSVRIGFMAGFGPEWSDIPADLGHAVFLLAAHFYEYRHDAGGSRGALPIDVQALIERYRTVRLFMGGRS